MTPSENQTVREIALDHPETVRVFETLGIDYCCGGHRSLKDACAAASVTVEDVLQRLTSAAPVAGPEDLSHWLEATLCETTGHIVEKHHGFVKRETPRLQGLLEKVRSKHDQDHPELRAIELMFQAMSEELRTHMFKEEQMLFPHMQRLEAAAREGRPAPQSPFGSVANPIARMMAEHDDAGELLRQMRSATRGYTLPEGACPTYAALYHGLEEFERDLHTHVHLENNILFPRALTLERNTSGERHGAQ